MPEKRSLNYAKGFIGEDIACEFLQQKGLLCIDRRVRSPYGEIDLIMLDGDVLCFVEVKAREKGTRVSTQLTVTLLKQKRLIASARCYLGEHPEHSRRLARFDIVTICPEGIDHIPNAFQGSEW